MSAIPTDDLNKIKEKLEQKINESSESESSSSDTSSSYTLKKKRKSKIDYKTKYNQCESKYRYLQLEMSNANIEINELKEKTIVLDKHNLLTKNINFLFERLDNAFKILNERLIIKDENIIKFTTLNSLKSLNELCLKTKDKYEGYINTNVYPLFLDDQHIFKISITNHYLQKIKEFDNLLLLIKTKSENTILYNTFVVLSLVICSLFVLNIIIFAIYFFLG